MKDKQTVSFNIRFLERSAINLAKIHKVSSTYSNPKPIKPILQDAKQILNETYRTLSKRLKSEKEISSASKWLLDNFYIIQEQIVEISVDFPRAYQKSIPVLLEGEYKGYPRIYEVIRNILIHTDNVLDNEVLLEYIRSYQEEETLKLGELWAIPIMIRLFLIQMLAEKASHILDQKKISNEVDEFIKEIDNKNLQEPGVFSHAISNWIRARSGKLGLLYLIELYNHLFSKDLLEEEEKRWFDYQISKYNVVLEDAITLEAKKQSRLQLNIQNAVVSLREITETDWSDFVEDCSVIDRILMMDPAEQYSAMDFQTRDRYRQTIEKLSRGSNLSETEVSNCALQLAKEQAEKNPKADDGSLTDNSHVMQHIGYFLIGDGYDEITKKVGYSFPIKERFFRLFEKHFHLYLITLFCFTILFVWVLLKMTGAVNSSISVIAIVILVAFFPALDFSLTLINRIFTILLTPRILPKMNYRKKIPATSRTLVVIPTMITSRDDVLRQIENLEIHSLANPDYTLQFALLSDFRDASEKSLEGENEILETAENAINHLNNRYSSEYGNRFFILHRERLWNNVENIWMGWERKRGKLEELNSLICNPTSKTSFTLITGDFLNSLCSNPVQFVITLDADTKLPPDSAKKLISTIAHPLNRAWYDHKKNRITRGYSIIQPRISFSPESARYTWFSKIFSGNVGIDPYSAAVSDIYQDLSGEAIFTGKGIYDVRVFNQILRKKFPENRILSHDLLESGYLRVGLATDIELFDDYPSTYNSYTRRAHRWARGDWQIAAWLFSKVPRQNGENRNPLNLLSKWKIFDNLRRSLNFLFLTIFFVAGLFLLPGSWWVWIGATFGILAFQIYVNLSSDLLNRPARVGWQLYMEKVSDNLKINTAQAISTVIIFPHQAFNQLDAVLKSLYRLVISKKGLLEWETASHSENESPNSLISYLRLMVIPIVLGVAIFITALVIAPSYLWFVTPFSLFWVGSPFYVWYISQPIKKRFRTVNEKDRQRLRMYARRTWFYFERFVNEEHNWLPPDNYQEDPPLPVVEKTSPTNMGLGLVSNQVAYNMGYITMGELLERQQKSLHAINLLDKHNGHFFNWYETRLGNVLNPRYISTVDSGNLAASLIVVKEAIEEVMNTRGINKNIVAGLQDSLLTIREIFDEYNNKNLLPENSFNQVSHFTNVMLKKLSSETELNHHINLDLLRALKQDAVSLSAVNLLSADDLMDERRIGNMLFWIESPLKLIEKAIAEHKFLLVPEEINVHAYSPHELSILLKNDDTHQDCYQILEKWQNLANDIISLSEKMIENMDFSFLYLKKRGLFSIGYNLDTAQLDKGTYDLLASEARIASYIAISKGDVPVEHWFRLSRRLTKINREEILLSWGGSMFEYLMPLLFMRSFQDTILSHTYKNVVNWQKIYGNKRNLPWGFSESAYYFLNIDMQYQYRSFGVPGLGLKRGLADEYVVSPYASLLALMEDSEISIQNLKRIEKSGGLGLLGFYDAIDYTPSHMLADEPFKIVKIFMVHHHGMSLIALDNFLNGWTINNNFHADSSVKSLELILQERIPRGVPIKEPHPIDAELEPKIKSSASSTAEHSGINELDTSPPRLHTLSDGNFSAMITHAGTGYSVSNGIMTNSWKPDPTEDPLGFFFYIKDTENGKFWSAMHQPVKRKPDRYDTWFHNGKMECSRVDDWIETTSEICVSVDHQIELRRLTLTNYSDRERILEISSYAEVVLNRMVDHNAHPTFSKLFVETEYLPMHHTILAKRRPRSKEEKPIWLVHTIACNDHDKPNSLEFETERSNFIGKGRTLSNPKAMDDRNRFKGSQGNVSDPIVSFRKKIKLNAGQKIKISFGLGFARSRGEAIQMADIYDSQQAVNRAFDLATVHGPVLLNHIAINSRQAHYFHKLSSYIYYADPLYRTNKYLLQLNQKKQHDLWPYGISGDFPLVIFRINDSKQLKHVKSLFKAHAFWRMRGIESELLIINEHAPGYIDEVQDAIQLAIESSLERDVFNKRGGVFTCRADKIKEEDFSLLFSVAHAIFDKKLPNFSKTKESAETNSWYIEGEKTVYSPLKESEVMTDDLFKEKQRKLQFFNGYGGFSEDGKEYHILIIKDPDTGLHIFPTVPWINVIANHQFGFTVSERGAGYTWSENSRENKLTSWSNDPITDLHSEAFYIRDEKTKEYWSPTPGPVFGSGFYHVIHGFGYTSFHLTSNNLDHKLIQFVPENKSVKISKLILKNTGSEIQKLSVFRYLERVLGIERTSASRFVIQEASDDGKTIFARNNYNNEFAGRTVFTSVINSLQDSSFCFTTDRQQFIGRNRSLDKPVAITSKEFLENKIQTGGDSCAAIQTNFELASGEEVTLIFLEGETRTRNEADSIIQYYSDITQADTELQNIKSFWRTLLSKIQVKTPDKSLDVMMNGWLMYQTISSRIWARTGFYQAGGAFGFRDQLQDAAAAMYVDPKLCRKQILLHARHQFKEGDVLHWWHPPTGRGIRSKITDDRLWLPYTVEFYLQSTNDESILKEELSYIFARELKPSEHEAYLHPNTLQNKGTLYEHCCKAIDISLQFGIHDLPLIGGGDWNDGMNRVGEEGKGESVWLGFFIYYILIRFEKVCLIMNDISKANEYKTIAENLKEKLNTEGWDGEWYLRAFYDDGTPLGSSENNECRIDAISQAWSIFSEVASEERSKQALRAVEKNLVSEGDKLIRLLTPPFNKTDKDPGYIKGYIPGVRENGGQYTHAALWTVKAFAEMGYGEKAVHYLNMINPINHALNQESADKYKVEPFVVAADVYGEAPLTGKGGWTWYTGSAGWMYRVALESVLGLQFNGDSILLKPSISKSWKEYSIDMVLDNNKTTYTITIENPEGHESGMLEGSIDGENVTFKSLPAIIPIKKDKQRHQIMLTIKKV
ncbi:glycosyltransferase 36 [Psychroflexus sp. YR1-1]|uniref:Glycosyltransferase 36 n=1 Tax=Psychroflexus aurantiacus TaxID=2709310 RepID=A0A6B3R8I7_9FLAO|nr:glucoamylase family protein [Psychroflexus aurantiacus]NEV93844.1 glycosyltransferase 36 [Psychroflexus aurantiacus]